MAFALALISIVLSYFSPASLFPKLAPYHIQQILLIPAIAISLTSLTMRRAGLQSPQYILMIGLWGAVAMSFMSRLALRASLDVFLEFAIYVCLYFLVACNTFTVARVRLFCMVLSACAVVMGLQGILAYHAGYWGQSLVLEWGIPGVAVIRRIRGWGVLNDPNDFAQFLLIGIALLPLFAKKRDKIASVVLLTPPALILLYAIYLTQSRGAIFGLIATLYVVFSSRLGKAPAAVFTALLFVMMVVLQFGGGREISIHESSAAGRLFAWGAGLGQLKSNPLFGSGFGQFTEYNDLTAHNSFVLCFAELGLFGYFFWLALIVVSVWGLENLVRLPVKTAEDARFTSCAVCLRAALYAFLVTAWFLSRTYTHTLYILLALVAALIQIRQPAYPNVVKPARSWIPLTVALQMVSIIVFYISVRLRTL